ncbi:MAG TPA: S8 family serine peptidase [Hyphomicrobiaceae bacterium]|nr:S8 family serine peptidase [Hyphomicrobiaceae bacterium]
MLEKQARRERQEAERHVAERERQEVERRRVQREQEEVVRRRAQREQQELAQHREKEREIHPAPRHAEKREEQKQRHAEEREERRAEKHEEFAQRLKKRMEERERRIAEKRERELAEKKAAEEAARKAAEEAAAKKAAEAAARKLAEAAAAKRREEEQKARELAQKLQAKLPTPAPVVPSQAPAAKEVIQEVVKEVSKAVEPVAIAKTQSEGQFEGPIMRAGIPVEKEAGDPKLVGRLTEEGAGRRLGGGAILGLPRLPPPPEIYKAGELLLPNPSPSILAELRKRGYLVGALTPHGAVQITLPAGAPQAWELQRELEKSFPGENVGLNFIYKPYHEATKDSAYPKPIARGRGTGCSEEQCYGRGIIAWKGELAACAAGVSIGLIDTMVDRKHPVFAHTNLEVHNVAFKHDAPAARHWHGTGVLSVMAGGADSRVPGLIPDARYVAVNAFFTNSKGELETDTAHLTEALALLDKAGVRIVNMSIVGPSDDLVHDRIADMARRGVVFVAAAGNGGPDAPAGYPAAYEEVIAVTAVDRRRGSYDSANRGTYIDVAAPGVQILTALPDGQLGMLSGTSFAAPFVTSVVAVAYEDTQLARAAGNGADHEAPKAVMLSKLFGKEELAKRSPVYGHGVIRAPAYCGKQMWSAAVAPVGAPTAASTIGGWSAFIQPSSLFGARRH